MIIRCHAILQLQQPRRQEVLLYSSQLLTIASLSPIFGDNPTVVHPWPRITIQQKRPILRDLVVHCHAPLLRRKTKVKNKNQGEILHYWATVIKSSETT